MHNKYIVEVTRYEVGVVNVMVFFIKKTSWRCVLVTVMVIKSHQKLKGFLMIMEITCFFVNIIF
jgi:hypothetical protein